MNHLILVNNIEQIVVIFVEKLISCNRGICKARSRKNVRNITLLDRIVSCKMANFQRSSFCFYLLMEVHNLLLAGDKCSLRELFYKDPANNCKTINICNSLKDVCVLLRATPWNLGISASGKGLIAGSIRMLMINGDMIDCYTQTGAVLLPQDHNAINHLETSASFVLIVEKDTIFSKFISQKIFETIGNDIILITGKGYPDLCTRHIVHRLSFEHKLPIYALCDADPFGIEILLIYQFGSRKMPYNISKNLICPKMQWLGIHPSELNMFNFSSASLNNYDNRKLENILRYNYLKPAIRAELQIMQLLQKKVHIDELHCIAQKFLINDYLPNKIKRNLTI
ncbi:meiotic recombination protein W68 [Bactrocera tryoni]|uniref:meiotic recombination protein W68 n=1 Tax=Bactrocera tryoni TaxID=59916 RepID=UPI001A974934|nr:meiotic recombination protein W68 [Bactrocera tryoni]